jgi:hypothetical protein
LNAEKETMRKRRGGGSFEGENGVSSTKIREISPFNGARRTIDQSMTLQTRIPGGLA